MNSLSFHFAICIPHDGAPARPRSRIQFEAGGGRAAGAAGSSKLRRARRRRVSAAARAYAPLKSRPSPGVCTCIRVCVARSEILSQKTGFPSKRERAKESDSNRSCVKIACPCVCVCALEGEHEREGLD